VQADVLDPEDIEVIDLNQKEQNTSPEERPLKYSPPRQLGLV